MSKEDMLKVFGSEEIDHVELKKFSEKYEQEAINYVLTDEDTESIAKIITDFFNTDDVVVGRKDVIDKIYDEFPDISNPRAYRFLYLIENALRNEKLQIINLLRKLREL